MAEMLSIIPWGCLLLVFGGMLALCWKLASGQHDLSTLLAQALAQAQPGAAPAVPPVPKVIPPALPAPAAKPAAAPAGPFSDYPAWFQKAVPEIGFHETGNNQGID